MKSQLKVNQIQVLTETRPYFAFLILAKRGGLDGVLWIVQQLHYLRAIVLVTG